MKEIKGVPTSVWEGKGPMENCKSKKSEKFCKLYKRIICSA